MSHLNLNVNAVAFDDIKSSNNPLIRPFDLTYKLASCAIENPVSVSRLIPPQTALTLFNGTRTTAIDGTTAFTVTQPVPGMNTYQFTSTAGTPPVFRTDRAPAITPSTQFAVTVNGPISTLTFTDSGTFATFTGQAPGMTTNVTLTALTAGTTGNSIVLAGDGVSSIYTLIAAWNVANPSNQVVLTSGNGDQIPDANTYATFSAIPAGCTELVNITANNTGTIGNSAVITVDGSTIIGTLVSNWNTANPSNQITLQVYAKFTGLVFGMTTSVTITANSAGQAGNAITLVGNGVTTINALITAWNLAHPSNMVTLTSGDGTQAPGANINLSGASDPTQVPSGGTHALFDGTVSGFTTPVIVTANNAGTAGNITLIGDGTNNLNNLISNWNAANPSNMVTLTMGDGTQVADVTVPLTLATGTNPAIIQLAGGVTSVLTLSGGAAGTSPNFSSVVPGDILNLLSGVGCSAGNLGTFVILSSTSTSLSIQNLNANPETFTVLNASDFLVYSNGSVGNQVQVGDTVVLSLGFSPATRGSYIITAVTPLWFQVEIAYPAGIPLETGIIPTAAGMLFYSVAKEFILIAAQQQCSVRFNGDTTDSVILNPAETNNPEKPALLLKQGTVYSLAINNLSLQPLNVLIASAE
jgi:hypothetical protein